MLHLAGRRGYMGYIGWIGAEAEAIPVTFLDQTGAKRLQAKVSPDMPVKKILPSVISAMRLPAIAPDGTPMSFSLDHKEGGVRLLETDTLADARVRPGDHLIVYPEIVAGMLGDLDVQTRGEVEHLLRRARNRYDAGDARGAIQMAEDAMAAASDMGFHSLVRRAENFIVAIEQRTGGEPRKSWYFMGLGLHSEAEQDYAERLAEEHYGLAWQAVEARQRDKYLYSVGYLNAIRNLASQEGALALAGGVSGMIRELERVGSRVGW